MSERLRVCVGALLAVAALGCLLALITLPQGVGATGPQEATAPPAESTQAMAAQMTTGDEYLSPSEMAISPDGRWLYVVCERSDQLLVVDTQSRVVTARIGVGHVPRGVALAPDGRRLYVTNSWDDTVTVVDAEDSYRTSTFAVGAEPYGVVIDRSGKTLYVANRISNDVSVMDAATGVEKKRLMAGRGASYLTLSADGTRIYCTHVYPKTGAARTAPESEVTVIDTGRESVIDRVPLNKVAGVFHVATSTDGRLVVAAEMQPKNLVPLAHVEHGWAIGNTLTLFGSAVGEPVQFPIDELERYFSLPYGVAITPHNSRLYVSTSGSDSVTVVDLGRLLEFARKQKRPFNNDLSASANYVVGRIAVGRNPRGIVLAPDGGLLYVANRLDDTLAVIDTRHDTVTATIALGGRRTITPLRRGEQIFHSARYAFQGQFGCANCHIDSTFDALTWDLEPDGFGKDIVDNRLLEDVKDTEPYKWNGGNPDLPTECGPRTEKYFWRSQNYSNRELTDLVVYVRSLPPRPNRFRQARGLTAAEERGQAIFTRTRDTHGNAIPEKDQCAFCHSGPKYTNQKSFDVGTGKATDRSPVLDTPQLTNIALTAPYLHDGSARSLEEIWTMFNPQDRHGVTNDLTKDELNDLIEYLRTL